MSDCNDPKHRPDGNTDRRRDAILQALLLQRSGAVEHRERISHSEAAPASVGGAFLSMLPLAGPGMVEHAVQELREHLQNGSGSIDDICQSWSAVERCLCGAELEELRSQVFRRLYPEEALGTCHARHGDVALGGR